MFGDKSSEEAVLYYLYMMADGNISYSEEKIFDELCEKLRLSAETRKEVIQKCKDIMSNMTDIFRVIVKEKLMIKREGLFMDSGLIQVLHALSGI